MPFHPLSSRNPESQSASSGEAVTQGVTLPSLACRPRPPEGRARAFSLYTFRSQRGAWHLVAPRRLLGGCSVSGGGAGSGRPLAFPEPSSPPSPRGGSGCQLPRGRGHSCRLRPAGLVSCVQLLVLLSSQSLSPQNMVILHL